MRSLTLTLALTVVLVLASATARAASWTEVGDAGDSIAGAQTTAGTGPLTTIQGRLATDTDVDLYCIRVTDPAQFNAWLQCVSFADNDVWLFDPSGIGVSHHDGCMGGQTNVGTPLVTAAGVYYLGISPNHSEAWNAANNPIWLPAPAGTQRAPDGPGAPGPLAAWGGAGVVSNFNNYTVQLSGAAFCDAAVPAGATTWGRTKMLYR